MMDDETMALARHALANAFYTDFSDLVNKYLKAAEGVDDGDFDQKLQEMANVFGRDDKALGDFWLTIWTQQVRGTCGHQTMTEALEYEPALGVRVQGVRVFERRDGEWYFVG